MHKVLTVIITFILMFNPVLFGFNLMQILTVISIIYLLKMPKKTISMILNKKIFIINVVLAAIIIYLILISLFQGTPIRDIVPVIYLLVQVLPISLTIILRAGNELTSETFLNNIVAAGILQAVLAILSYLFPVIQEFFVNQLLRANYNDVVLHLSQHRMYGFSTMLTFAAPAIQSIVVILIILTQKLNIKTYITIILLAFSAIVNARTSLVIFAIGLLLILALKNKNIVLRLLSILVIIVFAISLSLGADFTIDMNIDNDTFNWVIKGYNEIIGFINGESETGYFSYVTDSNKYVLPTGLHLFIGRGSRIMHSLANFGVNSDVGFINDIWLGGLFYVVMLYSLIMYVLFVIRNHLKYLKIPNYNTIFIFLIITLLVLNFKGFVFSFNSVLNTVLLICYQLIFIKKNNEYNSKL